MALNRNQSRRSVIGGADGFQRLGERPSGDATVNIPLGKVASGQAYGSGPGAAGSNVSNEKAGFFGRGKGPAAGTRGARAKGKGKELTTMGKIYDKVFNFSVVTRYLLCSLPLGLVLAVPIVLGATVFSSGDKLETADGIPIVWVFTWAEVVWIALWASKIFAKFLPRIFEFMAGAVSPGVKKYSLAISRLEIPISLVGWAVATLATFIPIMSHHPDPQNQCQLGNGTFVECGDQGTGSNDLPAWTGTMQSILTAALVATFIFLAEKMFVQFVSINYHSTQYERRIKDSKHQVQLLGVLYDASCALFEPFCPEFQEEDYLISDSLSPVLNSKHPSRGASGSATPIRFFQNVGRFGDQITSAFGRVAHEVTGKDVFNPTASHSVVVEALEKKKSCEALARRIWMSLVVEGKDALYLEDVQEVLADRGPEEALEAFQAVDRDGNGDVSLDEMILTVCEIGRERKAVATSLHNIDSAINVLDNLLLLLVFFAVVFVFVAFLNSSFDNMLATAGATLLSVSFIFSSTAAEILNSCIFLFVKHPYDVDDRVDVNNDQLVVERISLLYTVFRNIQTHKTTQAPNSVLNALWIDNVTRSKAMREQLLMYISFDTTLEDVELLRREMQSFVLENSRDFEREINVEVTGIASMDKLELKVEIKHKSNWSNETVRAARRSKFMCALVLALRRVPIYAPGGGNAALGSADAPSYSVSVTDDIAVAARQRFADAKAEKHIKISEAASMVGGASAHRTGSTSQRSNVIVADENSALTALNMRSPASDPTRDGTTDAKPPLQRDGLSPVIEDDEGGLLQRQSTRGKRHSPGFPPGQQPQMPSPTGQIPLSLHDRGMTSLDLSRTQSSDQSYGPDYGNYGNYVNPPARTAQPPGYASFPPPPGAGAPTTPSNGPPQGRVSPPRPPRYDLPPAQQPRPRAGTGGTQGSDRGYEMQ